ncbi:MAG: acetyl-CoA carboxylase biotin carboxyl carrier protein [Candidatus Limnocylindrales bacterium]
MSDEPVLPAGGSASGEHAPETGSTAPTNGTDHGGRQLSPVPVGPGAAARPAPSTSTTGGRSRPRDGDLMSSPVEAPGFPAPADSGDATLLTLVDRLAAILERGDLAELEVSAGGTTIIVRSPASVERVGASAALVPPADGGGASGGAPVAVAAAPAASPAAPPVRPSVKAPLTGIFYGAPSPGATPYVSVGDHVAVGQIIGLIEAMKLFNEIKSDLAGKVVRICADNGQLVKAKSPLIEVEPA